jgi:hypothetical protein
MSLVEAVQVMSERKDTTRALTVELAERLRGEVGAELDDSVELSDLYFGSHTHPNNLAGTAWKNFVLRLNPYQKMAITRSLGALAFIIPEETGKRLTVGDIRRVRHLKDISRQQGIYRSVVGLSFFRLAFEQNIIYV